ncbi:MAG: protein kinase domain-containing protein [Chthoniobacterales bacterium]
MTSSEKTQRVAEIVESALELGGVGRAQFLDDVCANDMELRVEAESLLKFQEKAHDFIETPACESAAPSVVDAMAELRTGQSLGDYKILSLLGEGGMGEVYLAEDTARGRNVAIKLIKSGLGTASLIRHFRNEERILAGLNHTNIARLYGGGVTADGLPYFVMEYVEGLRIDDFCRDKKLSLKERLDLFRKVCAALAYAHQHLVIHRDIKPANIRVTPEGEPKLLDFGIAKLLDPATSAISEQTITLQSVMTPDYASPEQVRGETMTTASDVYSLGVVLYELLTGAKPYQLKSRKQQDISRAITEQEPPRPGVAGFNDRKSLKGDLDTIILQAMRKDPNRRYVSVAQFSEDIGRFLQGKPVSARKDTWRYRAGKFVRRNKIGAMAAALVAIVLLGAMGAIAWQARVARQQRDVAQAERIKAVRINEFLQRMLSFSNQSVTSLSTVVVPKNVTVNEMLDRTVPQVESALADQPEVGAVILRTIGTAYESQGQYASAEKNLRQALQTQEQLYGANNAEVAETMMELAALCTRQQKLAEGGALMEKVVAFYRRQRQTDGEHFRAIKLAEALDGLAVNLNLQGQPQGSLSLLSEAHALAAHGPSLPQERSFRAAIKTDLGGMLVLTGDVAKGEPLLQESLAEYRAISKQPRWETGATLTMLGVAAWARQSGAEAQAFLIEGEHVYRQTLGDTNPYVAWNLNCQAGALFQIGDFTRAETKARESLALWQELFPENRLSWMESMRSLADILIKTGRFREGEDDLRQIIALDEEQPAKNYSAIVSLKVRLSQCLLAQNRFSEAEAIAVAANDEAKAKLDAKSRASIAAQSNLEKIRQQAGGQTSR